MSEPNTDDSMNVVEEDNSKIEELLRNVGNPELNFTDVQVTDKNLIVDGNNVGTADSSGNNGTKKEEILLTGNPKKMTFKEMLPQIFKGVILKLRKLVKGKNGKETDDKISKKPKTSEEKTGRE